MRKILLVGLLSLCLAPAGALAEIEPPVNLTGQTNQTAKIKNPKQYGRQKLNDITGNQAVETPSGIQVENIQIENYYRLIPAVLSQDRNNPVEATIEETKSETNGNNSSPAVENQSERKPVRQNSSSKTSETVIFTGECYLDRTLNISTLVMPADLNCTFSDGSTGTLQGIFKADLKTYALLFQPQRVILDSGAVYKVKGIVYNGDRTSINLADKVNKRFLERIAAQSLLSGANAAFDAYNTYAQNKDSETVVAGSSGTVIQQKSIPSNYPVIAGVLGAIKGAVQGAIGLMQGEFQNIPVIYKVYGGKVFYVELEGTPINAEVRR